MQQGPVWYLGRDGQQFGPIADLDFQNALETGQLLATDFVWRDGFAEWRTVADLFPPRSSAPYAPPASATARAEPSVQTHPAAQAQHLHPAPDRPQATLHVAPHEPRVGAPTSTGITHKPAKVRRPAAKRNRSSLGIGTLLGTLFFIIMLPAAAYVVWISPDLRAMASALIPGILAGFGSEASERIIPTKPIGGFAPTIEATDAAMQQSRMWQVLKRYHGDWYAARVQEASDAARAGKSEIEIATSLLQAVATLRRQYAGDASSASLPRLKTLASLFASNLALLRTESVDTCYQYASTGENAPAVIAQFLNPKLSSALQAQVVATFEAIEDGRKTPRVYPAPRQQDYDTLVAVLATHGWKDKDLQLFSDSKALAQAPPETVCRLVTEWFQSQLAIGERDAQLRLLVDSLRPMVAG